MRMMLKEARATFKQSASRKRPTNVSLSQTLVDEARELGINLSKACEEGLAAATRAERERRWLEQNREAIQSNWDYVEKHGMPLAHLRLF